MSLSLSFFFLFRLDERKKKVYYSDYEKGNRKKKRRSLLFKVVLYLRSSPGSRIKLDDVFFLKKKI